MTDKRQRKKNKNDTPPPEPETIVLPVEIPANPLRKTLFISANPANDNIVWIGGEENTGIPLLPGEKLPFETSEAISVLGQAGDWVHVAELVTVPPLSRPSEET